MQSFLHDFAGENVDAAAMRAKLDAMRAENAFVADVLKLSQSESN